MAWGRAYSGSLEEGFASGLPVLVVLVQEILLIHKGHRHKHHSLVEQQADLGTRPLFLTTKDSQDIVKRQQRHVWMHKLHIGLEEGYLEASAGNYESAFFIKKGDVEGSKLRWQRLDVRRKMDCWRCSV